MENKMILALSLFAATVAFGIAPLVTAPFTGYDPNSFPIEISRPFIQPAGFAFSIWGIIYVALFVHAGFGLLRRVPDAAWSQVRLPMIVSLVLGIFWLKVAASYPIIATVGIWAMLIAALIALLRADPARDRWLLVAPIAVYAGWLSAAAAVSMGVVLAGYGWLSNTGSAVAMLALVLVVAVTVQLRKRGVLEYGATVIWALIGVIAVNWGDARTVAYAACAGIVVMAGTMFVARR